MDIGNDTRYKCPSCKKNMYTMSYTSYWESHKRFYSDGVKVERQSVLSAPDTPNLAKCPHCGSLSFLNNLKGKEIERYSKEDLKDDFRKRKYVEKPELDDIIKAVKDGCHASQGLAKTKIEEIELRTILWHKLNDEIRSGDYEFTKKEMDLWLKNCEALLTLHTKTRNDDNDPNTIITIAELHRNTGNFEECMRLIKTLPKTHDWLKRQYAKQCKEENRFVFEIKPKKEKKSNPYDLPQV